MEERLRDVAVHMRDLGLGALAHANWHASHFSMDNRYWPELSVLQAAHAAELLIKARISEEHPLLIFEALPKMGPDATEKLSFDALLEKGRTITFLELPERLWATTGLRLSDPAAFKEFGKLRNMIAHFTAPSDQHLGRRALDFIYRVIDPFIHECWGLYALDFDEDTDGVDLIEALIRQGIQFLVPPMDEHGLQYVRPEWPSDDPAYESLMKTRFEASLEAGRQAKDADQNNRSKASGE